MTRPTLITIDTQALLHNIAVVRKLAPNAQLIAMVKANAYGCGIENIVPYIESSVDILGVACLSEALAIRDLGIKAECMLLPGVFDLEELQIASAHKLQCVFHQAQQLRWLVEYPLVNKLKIWIKIDTGMSRLGFAPDEAYAVVDALRTCPWINREIGLMSHLAYPDPPNNQRTQKQLMIFNNVCNELSALADVEFKYSMANSAAILTCQAAHLDAVRPGIMLYGASPFADNVGVELGLQPVMHFHSAISSLHHYPAGVQVGYNGTWRTQKPSIIAVVPVGYGDGYPRHISPNTNVWLNDQYMPIIGRISMDMLTVDVTECMQQPRIGDCVELWGRAIPIEHIAQSAGTIAYELMCQTTARAHKPIRC